METPSGWAAPGGKGRPRGDKGAGGSAGKEGGSRGRRGPGGPSRGAQKVGAESGEDGARSRGSFVWGREGARRAAPPPPPLPPSWPASGRGPGPAGPVPLWRGEPGGPVRGGRDTRGGRSCKKTPSCGRKRAETKTWGAAEGAPQYLRLSERTPVSVHLSARPGEKVTFKDQALSQDQDTSRFQFIRSREIRLRLGHPTLPSSTFPPASMPRGTPAETPPLTGFPVSGGKPVPLSQLLVPRWARLVLLERCPSPGLQPVAEPP
ncbi:translation initiation factor IF-2-like [Rissa tridactyla]|uniref:translation initiation factor IF-2-like n=1 Tax=Rissa tridactyla TaxID=75485 RepID=UPI0023BA8227|nr:translation initiation factor IF-2-like [Rissa tridactyla]